VTTFVLVHGSWHGAWCWDRLVPELEALGHRAVAMDLPIDDPSAGLAEYADVVAPFIPDESAVLVGHSLGASVIPLVAAQRAVRRMVFLCPVIRRLGMSLAEQAPLDVDISTYNLSQGRTFFDDSSSAWEPDAAIAAFFPDCDPTTARWAASRLRRQYWRYWEEPNPLTAWPDTPRSAIVGADDQIIGIGWARRRIPELLRVTPVELPGGHSPFLSRPAELAAALVAGL
jgi:pimeloyl-ACP methyl ester carboxylesterase